MTEFHLQGCLCWNIEEIFKNIQKLTWAKRNAIKDASSWTKTEAIHERFKINRIPAPKNSSAPESVEDFSAMHQNYSSNFIPLYLCFSLNSRLKLWNHPKRGIMFKTKPFMNSFVDQPCILLASDQSRLTRGCKCRQLPAQNQIFNWCIFTIV